MNFSLTAFLQTAAVVFPVELPDKTLVATLILTTRYRALPVFLGVSAAFAVQCVIAVLFGGLLSLLPDAVVAAVVALLFAVGAVVLIRESLREDDGTDVATAATTSPRRMAAISFGVLFAAEWGDASQLATAAMTAHTGMPLSVGLGAFTALVTVAAIAVLLGRGIADRLPKHLIQRGAGVVFAILAVLAAVQAVRAV